MAVVIPPATRDGWSFSGNDFYVEVSNHNRHRRATVPELKAIYDGVDTSKDRPAHWYEAQLMHYGLPPSKNKGTAKMRLFDAVNKSNLSVPANIAKVESELKKEWTKRDREVKQALKKHSTAGPAKKSTKRKADDAQVNVGTNLQVNVSLSIGPQGNVQIAGTSPTGPATKKAKTVKKASSVKPANSKNAPPKSKVSATKDDNPKTPSKPRAKTAASKVTAPATKTKAITSKPSKSKHKAAPTPKPATTKIARRLQTARRGGRGSRGLDSASPRRPNSGNNNPPEYGKTPSHWDSYDDPPPPYPGSPSNQNDYSGENSGKSIDRSSADDDSDRNLDGHSERYSNGYSDSNMNRYSDRYSDGVSDTQSLLNGRYRLQSDGPRGDDSAIIFTLDENVVWASFEIGPLSGVLRLNQRPNQSSRDRLYFKWRGEDIQGGEHFEPDDDGFVRFLGDGRIQGEIGFYGTMLEFEGTRVPGQGMRSEISGAQMREIWGSYN
ncbi:hypothetical protein QBC44DRAFT_356114 [Cladorrhinum sp. PSN332]|nr:hypothetical protein QBC44DRAFT_356114 [Cladorrhinum sp. PSN332]